MPPADDNNMVDYALTQTQDATQNPDQGRNDADDNMQDVAQDADLDDQVFAGDQAEGMNLGDNYHDLDNEMGIDDNFN
jgi:hypothetical protein